MKPYRSVLFMPGHRPELVAKGIASGADAIVLDLEDSVPDADKVAARSMVAASIDRVRADGGDVGLFVRPNGLATRTAGSDLAAVVRPGLDGIFPPKIDSAADVHRFEALLEHAEYVGGAEGLEMIVPTETAPAFQNAPEIAAASPRIGAMIGGTARHADIARAVGFEWSPEGLESLYIRSRVLIACRAAGLHPLTGLWEDVADLEGLRAFAAQGRALGFRGMIVIHPSHVPVVNEAFTPTGGRGRLLPGTHSGLRGRRGRGPGRAGLQGSPHRHRPRGDGETVAGHGRHPGHRRLTEEDMHGKYYEEFEVGMVIRHALTRTVTEMDNILFTSLTMNVQPLHLDEEFAKTTVHGQRVMNSLFTLALIGGMTVPDTTFRTTLGNLGYDKIEFPAPVFHGDTLRAETTILDKRLSKSRDDAGIVWFEHRGYNQRDEVVVRVTRVGMMMLKPDPPRPGQET